MPPAPELAATLGVSEHAVALCRDSEVIDLHIDTFIPPRLWGYDPLRRHRHALLGRAFFGHLDLYRMADGGLKGAMWSITTNPARSATGRWHAFQRNLAGLQALVARSQGHLEIVRDAGEYRAARSRGAHAVMISIQGANALDAAPEGFQSIPDRLVLRATLVHLTSSALGTTNSPLSALRKDKHLTDKGRQLVGQLDQARAFVDLAHIHPASFWDAVQAHDRTLPLIATHTGVDGVHPHWRNLDDDQLRAIANTGGVVGIIFAATFLRRRGGPVDGAMVVEHMEHVGNVAGWQAVAMGSDYDGAIVPPPDLPGGESYPRLVQHMLDRGWTDERIRGVLGRQLPPLARHHASGRHLGRSGLDAGPTGDCMPQKRPDAPPALYEKVLEDLRQLDPDLRKKAWATLKREREETEKQQEDEQKLLPNSYWSKAHLLRRIPNPTGEAYEQKLLIPEFTFVGVKSQPDFGEMLLTFYPGKWTVELKSLKVYKDAYRDAVVSYERLCNVVYEDLMSVYQPIRLRMMMTIRPRGGISSCLTIDSDWKIRGGSENFNDWVNNTDRFGFEVHGALRV